MLLGNVILKKDVPVKAWVGVKERSRSEVSWTSKVFVTREISFTVPWVGV